MTEKDTTVRSIERALDILDCFALKSPELSLTEISRTIHLAISTTSRIIATLEKRSYLARDEGTQKYRLGSRLARIGALGFTANDLGTVARPIMQELNRLYNEGVSLYVVQDDYRVCIERVQSTQPLRRVINVGDRYPLTRGASGRVLLAYLPGERRKELLAKDPFTTEESLAELRSLGYTISVGEREAGVTSISAPVFNAKLEAVAALALSGPSVRFPEEDFPDKIAVVLRHAELISLTLGLQPGEYRKSPSRP